LDVRMEHSSVHPILFGAAEQTMSVLRSSARHTRMDAAEMKRLLSRGCHLSSASQSEDDGASWDAPSRTATPDTAFTDDFSSGADSSDAEPSLCEVGCLPWLEHVDGSRPVRRGTLRASDATIPVELGTSQQQSSSMRAPIPTSSTAVRERRGSVRAGEQVAAGSAAPPGIFRRREENRMSQHQSYCGAHCSDNETTSPRASFPWLQPSDPAARRGSLRASGATVLAKLGDASWRPSRGTTQIGAGSKLGGGCLGRAGEHEMPICSEIPPGVHLGGVQSRISHRDAVLSSKVGTTSQFDPMKINLNEARIAESTSVAFEPQYVVLTSLQAPPGL